MKRKKIEKLTKAAVWAWGIYTLEPGNGCNFYGLFNCKKIKNPIKILEKIKNISNKKIFIKLFNKEIKKFYKEIEKEQKKLNKEWKEEDRIIGAFDEKIKQTSRLYKTATMNRKVFTKKVFPILKEAILFYN